MKLKKLLPLLISMLFVLLILSITILVKQAGYGITYQVSASMPKGFYLLVPAKKIARNDVVVFYPPPAIKKFLIQHKWLPTSGMMMKHVMGVVGGYVCKKASAVYINGMKIGPVYKDYASGKILPSYPFCRVLKQREYLLLSTKINRSFDGRYFGPIKGQNIISKAIRIRL